MRSVRAQPVPYSRKVVLHCPAGMPSGLDALVEDFIRDRVVFVGVVGADCEHIEDYIDECVVGDGSRDYDLLTSSHPDQTLDEAVLFAKSLGLEFSGGEVQVVEP
jgi:hypothetical protein